MAACWSKNCCARAAILPGLMPASEDLFGVRMALSGTGMAGGAYRAFLGVQFLGRGA